MSEPTYYESLKASLEEALAYAQGKPNSCKVSVRSVPDPVVKASEVARIRKEMDLSQQTLAYLLGVSPRTVEAWEAGRNEPAGPARRLLYLLENDHSLVDRLIAR